MQKLTAITVSVNYDDIIIHTIEANHTFFDRWIIVTDRENYYTLVDITSKYPNIELIATNCFYKDGAKFRKYLGINKALKHVDADSWVLFLDADIILSKFTRRVLDKLNLDPKKLYGIDRLNCKGYLEWVNYLKGKNVIFNNWLLHSAGFEWGARIIHIYGEEGENGLFTGYKPLGFFQLAHTSQFTHYPEGSTGDATHGDLVFAKQWPRENRELIPEIMGIHLMTEDYKGMNHQGRKSSKFCYPDDIPMYQQIIDSIIIYIYSLFTCDSYYCNQCCICKYYRKFKKFLKWLIYG